MDLSIAAGYFDSTCIEGWNGTAWEDIDIEVNIVAFDRFISDRDFGQRKRNLTSSCAIPSQYNVIRIPGGKIYLLEASNYDTKHNEVYSYIYLIHEAPRTADIIRLVAGAGRPSGSPGPSSPTVVAAGVFCNITGQNSVSSEQVETLRHSTFNIFFPKGTDLRTGDELDIDGVKHTIRDRTDRLDLVSARIVRRDDT